MKTTRNLNVRILAECGILIALSTVLSVIKIFTMPLGGAVTLVSMLPICVISVRHGLKWGFASSAVYSIFQLVLGVVLSGLLGWGLTPWMLVGCALFDYIIAYTVLGFAGILRNKGEFGIYTGFTAAFILRFLSHTLSGVIVFKNLEQWDLFGSTFTNKPILYSACYNGLYMLPELIITLVVLVLIMRIPYVKKNIFEIK